MPPDLKRIAEHYDQLSKYYDRFNFLGRLFRFNLYTGLLHYLDPGDAALDVACGTGNMSSELTKRFQHVYGLDISKGMLKRSKRKVNYPVYGNTETIPFNAESFDAVTCILAVGHFPNTEMAVSEMKRVLKDGGILVVNLIERAPPSSLKDKIWWLIFKRIWKRLDPKWKKQSTDIDSKKLLRILRDAERYERRDLLDPFFRCHFNNTIFVYRKIRCKTD